MKRRFVETRAFDAVVVVVSLAFLAMVGLYLASLLGCTPSAGAEAASSRYGAELQACVRTATTREESRACRREVDCRWGQGPCTDGGSR